MHAHVFEDDAEFELRELIKLDALVLEGGLDKVELLVLEDAEVDVLDQVRRRFTAAEFAQHKCNPVDFGLVDLNASSVDVLLDDPAVGKVVDGDALHDADFLVDELDGEVGEVAL